MAERFASGRRTGSGAPAWDLPVRVFHWLLVLLVFWQIVTVSIDGNAMQLHARGGYAS
jgi:cytochrome b